MSFKRRWDGTYAHPDNLVDLFEDSAKKFKDHRLFGMKDAQENYQWVTYGEVSHRIDLVRGGLRQLGIGAGDAVGIIAFNRTEWGICAYATYGLGAHFVPMYEKELESVWQYIINDSGIKVVFVNTTAILEKINAWKDQCPSLEHVILINSAPEISEDLKSLEVAGEKNPVPSVHPAPSDLAMIIYTSGTTGDPKGVMLSHGNCSSNSITALEYFPEIDDKSVVFSHLPWAHSYANTAEVNAIIHRGGAIAVMESLEKLAVDMAKVQPTFLFSVPRVFNTIHHKVFEKMQEEGGMKLKLFNMALSLAKKKRETGKAGFMYNLLNNLVFGKLRAMWGGRLKGALTASAKMNPEIAQFFSDVGVNVYDCYGLTEASPAVTISSSSHNRNGSVGVAIKNEDIVIDKSMVGDGSEDGEVIVYGPNVMQGYLNKPEKTAEVLMDDGGLRTGDQGHLDADGFLYITGRFKEEYKLTNGKYVFPATIEEEIKELPYVTSAFVCGDGKPYNVMLIVPNMNVIKDFVEKFEISVSPDELLKNKAVNDLLTQEIGNHLRKKFGGYEIPRKMAFIDEDFTIENGMLTQTLKVKRRVAFSKYQDIIDSLYAEE
jgi:long-chain acyl-CoA synthetase